jgi:hypothetical protein
MSICITRGCSVPQFEVGWRVTTRVVTADTGVPFDSALVQLRLLRDGEPYGYRGYEVKSDGAGDFSAFAVEKYSGYRGGTGCFSGGSMPPDPVGPAPIEIEVLVRTATGQGRTIVQVDAGQITGYEYIEEVPAVGLIQLPPIAVELLPFPNVTTYSVPADPHLMTGADVDSDGDVDLVVAGSYRGPITVLLNNGAGAFPDSRSISPGIDVLQLVAGDVDGDGHVDFVAVGFSFEEEEFDDILAVLINVGDGTFREPLLSVLPHDLYWPDATQLVDVDGDGDLDLQSGPAALLNDGTGRFNSRHELEYGVQGIVFADLGGDGDADRITADASDDEEGGSRVRVALNDGAGAFGPPTEYVVADFADVVAAEDLDGDGRADVVLAVRRSTWDIIQADQVAIMFSAGNSLLPPITFWMEPYAALVGIGDFDGDDDLDVGTWNGQNMFNARILVNDGAGRFDRYEYLTVGPSDVDGWYPSAVVVADFDGNNQPDWAALGYGDSWEDLEVAVLLNAPLP